VTADLVAFLNARLDEDEQIAQATCCPDWTDEGWKVLDSNAALDEGLVAQTVQFQTDADHIARWDPARVLADVQAKRQILEHEDMWGEDSTILQFLAQPFADHPDFDPSWKL
jgi:hypothetical protein